MSIFFTSDVHISNNLPEVRDKFISFLEEIEQDAECLYILGDLFDVFHSYKQFKNKFYEPLIYKLKHFTQKSEIYFIRGNRDFNLNGRFTEICGVKVCGNYLIQSLGGRKVLLTHGDIFCSKDRKYHFYKSIIRSQVSQILTAAIPYSIKESLTEILRRGSEEHIKKERDKCIIIDRSVEKFFQDFDLDIIVCGHIHKMFHNTYDIKGRKRGLFVLGDWTEVSNYVVFDGMNFFQRRY